MGILRPLAIFVPELQSELRMREEMTVCLLSQDIGRQDIGRLAAVQRSGIYVRK